MADHREAEELFDGDWERVWEIIEEPNGPGRLCRPLGIPNVTDSEIESGSGEEEVEVEDG
jgi:hypothetical protein